MHSNGYRSYVENDVLTADPLKLVQLLYEGALEAVESARQHLRAGDIRARSQAITKGLAILHALSAALDHDKGGELSVRLGRLYDYIERLLIDANAKQQEGPLVEAHELLNELLEAWRGCTPSRHEPVEDAVRPETRDRALSYAG
jgi:flagellar secretion chaperone FliS